MVRCGRRQSTAAAEMAADNRKQALANPLQHKSTHPKTVVQICPTTGLIIAEYKSQSAVSWEACIGVGARERRVHGGWQCEPMCCKASPIRHYIYAKTVAMTEYPCTRLKICHSLSVCTHTLEMAHVSPHLLPPILPLGVPFPRRNEPSKYPAATLAQCATANARVLPGSFGGSKVPPLLRHLCNHTQR